MWLQSEDVRRYTEVGPLVADAILKGRHLELIDTEIGPQTVHDLKAYTMIQVTAKGASTADVTLVCRSCGQDLTVCPHCPNCGDGVDQGCNVCALWSAR